MRPKPLAGLGLALAGLGLWATGAMANDLSGASAAADCSGYTLTVTAVGLTSVTLPYTIDYTFNLTCGGSTTTVSNSITFIAAGSTATETATGTWPGAPLATNCTVAGSATLTNSGSTVAIIINGSSAAALGCAVGYCVYEVDASQTFVSGTAVTLSDRFVTAGAFTLERPKRLAAPADVSGSDPTAPTNPDHLVGYVIGSAPAFTPVSGLMVTNRFGSFTALLRRPIKLYVPASKGLTAPPPPLIDTSVDHFLCYDAGASGATKPTVMVTDQFGSRRLKLRAVREICDAVDKNGEGIPTPNQWLTCYSVRVLSGLNHPGNVFVDTQFGEDVLLATHPDELCVGSTVGP